MWEIPIQEHKSDATSINSSKLPTSIKKIDWKQGTRNADIGGGKFDNVTEYLEQFDVENIIYDPFNRSLQHNIDAISKIKYGQCYSATCNNVLNVIKEDINKERVIQQCENVIRDDGWVYIQIYEGDRSGVGKETSKGWQENRKTRDYITLIEKYLRVYKVTGNLIVCSK